MAGPWEKYASAGTGPWSKFQTPAAPSAQEAFEAGDPRAKKVLDSGEEIYARPVGAVGAAATGALKGATSVPFVYEGGAEQAFKLAGGTEQQAQEFTAAAEEQHPYLFYTAEAIGAAAGLPKLAGEAVIGGGLAAAKASGRLMGAVVSKLGSMADNMATGTFKLSSKVAERLGSKGLKKLAVLMDDAGVTNTPSTVSRVAAQARQLKDSTGRQLGAAYKLLDGELSVIAKTQLAEEPILLTKSGLIAKVKENIVTAVQKTDKLFPGETLASAEKELINLMDSAGIKAEVLKPSTMWNLAKELEKQAGKYTKSLTAKEGERGKAMEMAAAGIRDWLRELAGKVRNPATGEKKFADTLAKLNEEFPLYKAASDGMNRIMRDISRGGSSREVTHAWERLTGVKALESTLTSQPVRGVVGKGVRQTQAIGAKILGYGEALGPYLKQFDSVVRRSGLAGVVAHHAHLMLKDDKYRDLYTKLGQPDAQAQQ